MNEDGRQAFHLMLGLCTIALVLAVGIGLAAYIVGVVLVVGLVLLHLKHSNVHLGPLEKVIERFERPGVAAGYGATTYAAATLAILTLLANKEQILADRVYYDEELSEYVFKPKQLLVFLIQQKQFRYFGLAEIQDKMKGCI